MNEFKLSSKHLLLLPVIYVIIFLVWHLTPMIYNPLRRPAPLIRNHILRHTPIGMCIDEVIEIIENNERWGNPNVLRTSGFSHPLHNVPGWPLSELTGAAIVGDMSIRTFAERYSVGFIWRMERRVNIFWGFDEYGKLIEIFVDSTYV